MVKVIDWGNINASVGRIAQPNQFAGVEGKETFVVDLTIYEQVTNDYTALASKVIKAWCINDTDLVGILEQITGQEWWTDMHSIQFKFEGFSDDYIVYGIELRGNI